MAGCLSLKKNLPMNPFVRLSICVAMFLMFDSDLIGAELRFNRDIRPILSENCFACHGPDPGSRKAGLRLDVGEGAIADKVIVPGNASASELITRVFTDDADELMPPAESHKKLTTAQKDTLRRWINEGAHYEKHWAFIAPKRSDVPATAASRKWASNPIDHFIAAGVTEMGLQLNPRADRHTMVRRAALDATGLPPAPELLKKFLADQSADAFANYVGKLLSSKTAGEHRARYWLDAARYGDTHGMHLDNFREMWPYRDWVVNAFNSNMPFDRFVVEQIAGDMLPQATLNQRIATGFSRCNVSTAEGGSIPEEFNVRYMVDRVETTSTVFLGLTAGCAVCHDHKYDPISQKEFYSLGAFFNNTTQPAMDGNQRDSPPFAVIPAPEFEKEWHELQASRRSLSDRLANAKSGARQWWKKAKAQLPVVAEDGLILELPLTEEGGVALPKNASWATNHPAGKRGMHFTAAGGLQVDMQKVRSDEPLSISFWIRTPDKLQSSRLFEQIATLTDPKNAKKKTTVGWKLNSSTQGAVTFELHDGKDARIRGLLPGDEALTPRKWQHVCIRYSGGQADSAITVHVNGFSRTLRNASLKKVVAAELTDVKLKIAPSLPSGGLSDLRIYRRHLSDQEIELLAREFELRELIAAKTRWRKLEPAQQQLAESFHRLVVASQTRSLSLQLAATQRRVDYIHSRSTTTLVMEERDTTPQAWILERGEYDQRRDEVAAAVPAVFPDLPKGSPRNRVGLARWLVDPANPLTARVTVNRLWQSVFGIGLVKTAEDFGVMGESPTHPELLDWLAVEFIESGWDVRHMVNLMMTSSAYRQSSRIDPDEYQIDPDNRYLARGSRRRLDAEVLRDQALYVSGRLVPKMGGPGVKPFQPTGLWRVVAITGSNTRDFKMGTGEALYRRSLYTFWKRTSPPPNMAAFDAPTREQCTVRRERTNTPLQALVLMNDPQYFEAARALAELIIHQGKDDSSRARRMFNSVLVRPPSGEDMIDILSTVSEFKHLFKEDTELVQEVLKSGWTPHDKELEPLELAAWTMAANTLMNRDDFINKN
jgi:hypothetical protein